MNKLDKFRKAAADLQEMMEEMEPFVRRPVVVEPTTKGRWVRSDGKPEAAPREEVAAAASYED